MLHTNLRQHVSCCTAQPRWTCYLKPNIYAFRPEVEIARRGEAGMIPGSPNSRAGPSRLC